MTRPTTPLLALLMLCASLSPGCSGGKPRQTGLIEPGVELAAPPGAPGVEVRHFRVKEPERYYRFVVDPVQVVPAAGLTMDAELSERIADQFRRELVSRLANAYEVVDTGGAGVLRVRAAILDVRPSPAHGLAGARMEAIVSDSVTDRLILAMRDRRPHLNQMNRSLFSEWENAKSVMQAWAALIRGEVRRLGK